MIPGYRIVRELGRGGMATVYLAVQESLGREVALKVLDASFAADADFAERFLREARIAGGLKHRNLLPVYDAGRTGEYLFLAMEFVPGGHAGDLRGGDPDEIRRCLIDIAAGLAYAHAKGVVHRDIKPENILCREDGSYLLADFGIARSTQTTRELTGPQAVLGTPSYMSPEQWRGEAVDGRSDLYSLGILAFELLTGSTPFHGESGWAIGMQQMNAPRPRLPQALSSWQPLLDQLLAIDPNARFASANEVIAALGGKPEATPKPAVAFPQVPHRPTTPMPMRNPLAQNRIAALFGLALLLGAIGYWLGSEETLAPAPVIEPPQTEHTVPPQPTESVAVLPFRVLSSQVGDEHFADGLSEEILSSLAAIPELKVPGRTSSFAWKEKTADLREIATALGVAHLLEGSVRRAGPQLRITANLIRAGDGATIWSQSFDSDAEDIFAIQNEIAIVVADRLAVQIGARPLPTLARLPAAQRASYLETVGALRNLTSAGLIERVQTLREFEATGDGGPDLYVRLHLAIAHLARNGMLAFDIAQQEQQDYQRTLAARFAGSVEVLLGEALLVQTRGEASNRISEHERALLLFRQVLERWPNDPLAATQAAFVARTLLRHAEALEYSRRAVAIDPEDPSALYALANAQGSAGQGDAAVTTMQELVRRFPDTPYAATLALFLAGNGNIADAIMVDRDCLQSTRPAGCAAPIRLLRLLRFDARADAMLRLRPESSRLAVDGYDALRRGELPEAAYGRTSFIALMEAVAEAAAQQRHAQGLEYLRLGWPREQTLDGEGSAEQLDMRASIAFVSEALMRPDPPDAERRKRNLKALARTVAAMPPATMPYPTVFWALGTEILSGNRDAVFHRLDGAANLNPLLWQHWVLSPSGLEMPTAAFLRADARFADLWKRREDLIERERTRLKQLWPEIEAVD